MVDGRNDFDDAVHRHSHGGFNRGLQQIGGAAPPVRHFHIDPGDYSPDQPQAYDVAAISADDVPVGTEGGYRQRKIALCFDDFITACGLGHVVGGQLSHRHVWAGASAADSSGAPNAVCGLAQNAYDSRISLIFYISRASHGGVISHTGHSGRAVISHGPLAGPFDPKRGERKSQVQWH